MTHTNSICIILGENIKSLRSKLALTQAQLAEYVEISIPHLANIECGRSWVGAPLLEKFSQKLNVTPDVLLFQQEFSSYQEKSKDELELIVESALDKVTVELLTNIRRYEKDEYSIKHKERP